MTAFPNIPGALRAAGSGEYGRDGRPAVPAVRGLLESFHPHYSEDAPHQPMPRIMSIDTDTIYRIDTVNDQLVVSVLDRQGALLRQIPATVVLQMARRLEQVLSDRSLGLHAQA